MMKNNGHFGFCLHNDRVVIAAETLEMRSLCQKKQPKKEKELYTTHFEYLVNQQGPIPPKND